MNYFDTQQQNPLYGYNPQQAGWWNPQSQFPGVWPGTASQQASYLPGQAAYGLQHGQYAGQPLGWAQQFGWGQQRQLSQHDVSEVIRQLLPALPQILAQAQQPYPGFGNAAYGNVPRTLTQQDVNDIVRQLLPLVPQIVGTLQGQPYQQFAMHGGIGGLGQSLGSQTPFAAQNPLAAWLQQPWGAQSGNGQIGASQFLQPAFGGQQWNPMQRQLSQQDVAEVTRQLVGLIPQVIGNLQAINQQRMM
jgi:hypothetical protein